MNTRRFFRRGASLTVLAFIVLISPAAAKPPAPQGTDSTATPLAVQKYEVDGVQVELLSVKRSSGFLTVKWQYRNTTAQPQAIGEHTGAMSGAWSGPYSLSWDFRVLANGQEIKVPGQTLAQKHGPDKIVVIKPKKVYSTWAKVPDPGADVQKVTVNIQGADPFDDVTVT
jgi:hypothetical protein